MKRISILMLAVVLFLSLFACSNSEKSSSETTSTQKQSKSEEQVKPVVLQFWGAIPPENGPQELVDNWNASNPNIMVEYTRFVNDDAGNIKLETALMAGEVDVFINYLAPSLEKRIDAGMLLSLDDYLKKDGIDLETELGEYNYERNGVKYFVPTATGSNSYFLYNKDMLDAAGITLKDDWTWDEFVEIAKKLTHGEGNDKVYGASYGSTISNDDWAQPVAYAQGADYCYKPGSETESNFDDPLFLYAMKIRYQMEAVDKTMINRMSIKTMNMDVSAEFTKGKVAILIANYARRDINNLEKYPHDFKTGFIPAPVVEGQQKRISGGLREWISISPNSDKQDQAWQFLKYYAMDGFSPMCRAGRFPAFKNTDAATATSLILGKDGDKVFDIPSFEKYVVSYPNYLSAITLKNKARSQINQLMGEAFEKVLLGESTPEKAMEELKQRADEAIAASK